VDGLDPKAEAVGGALGIRPGGTTLDDSREIERIKALPKEVGVLLLVAGVGGLLLPGPIGTPFLILGGLVLWPKAFERVEVCLEKRFPKLHHQSLIQMKRFLTDLDRRYPLPK
jgi:hypothetical protein